MYWKYRSSKRVEVKLNKNGKYNKDIYYKNYYGRLCPVEKRLLSPKEIKRKAKAKKAKQARKINYSNQRLTRWQLKRRNLSL